MATTRQQIINSLFRPGSPNGDLIIHLKVHEQVSTNPNLGPQGDTSKPRYILLGVTSDARVKLHKSKRNSNGTFSIGKTWGLEELGGLEVIQMQRSEAQPQGFIITLNAKSYMWETESPAEQINFLVAVVRSFRRFTGNNVRVVGFEVTEKPGAAPPYIVPNSIRPAPSAPIPIAPSQTQPQRAPPPNNFGPPASAMRSASPDARQRPELFRQPTPTNQFNANGVSNNSRPPPRPSTAGSAGGSSYSMGSTHGQTRDARPAASPSHFSPPLPTQPYMNGTASRPPSERLKSPLMQPKMSPAAPLPSPQPQAPPKSSISKPLPASGMSRHGKTSSLSISAPIRPPSRNRSIDELPPALPLSPLYPDPPPLKASRNIETSQAVPSTSKAASPESLVPPESSKFPTSRERPAYRRAPSSRSETSTPFQKSKAVDEPNEEESVLANVEEMLEGFEWKASVGGAGQIERNLTGELAALEAASIHAIVESDDRVNFVVKHLDQAIAELDKLDLMISLYKTQLNVMIDDIDHIESQNKGLQVQTSNQRALLAELDNLLDTFNIPEHDLQALAEESLEKQSGIERLEQAAVSLYKAILSTRDTSVGDMSAANERASDYTRYSTQFCKRLFDFLSVMFRYQSDLVVKGQPKSAPVLKAHSQLEAYLERYVGLMLFVKEIDDQRYQQICAAYFATTSELYKTEVQSLFSFTRSSVRKVTEEEAEASEVFFNGRKVTKESKTKADFTSNSPSLKSAALRRVGTSRTPDLKKGPADQIQGGEAFNRALQQIGPHILREQNFITDLLHITGMDSYITFADFMQLETFFRRAASAQMSTLLNRFKDLRSSMDLVFGFLHQEIGDVIDFILQRDPLQIVGVLAAIDQCVIESKDSKNDFLGRALQKQGLRCVKELERVMSEQIKGIEQTKLTVKKRKGVVPFIHVFPLFVERLESQLVGAEGFPIRSVIDQKYELLVSTMFECLQQMAKMDHESNASAEDKDQLNYHVVLIENMSHFVTVARDLRAEALGPLVKRARDIYDENLNQYIRLMIRRQMSRLLDFFSGLEQLLRNTPPNEVTLHSAYSKSSAKKAVGSMTSKDMRKAVEALSKRVEKHFGDVTNPAADNKDVILTVWQACQDEMLRLTGTWQSLIVRCYADSGVVLFSAEDVDAAFKRTRPGNSP